MSFGSELPANVLASVHEEDNSVTFSDADIDNIYDTWGKEAWLVACNYAMSEDPTKVEDGTISGGAVTTETDDYWGLGHFRFSIKDALLSGNSLFPYFGMIPKRDESPPYDEDSRIFVITTNKIFKFDTDSFVYFNGAKDAIKHFIAAEYWTANGNSTYSDNRTDDGKLTYDTVSDEPD